MSGFAKTFKEEVVRLSRHESKFALTALKRGQVALKRSVAGLRRQVAALEKANRAILRDVQKQAAAPGPVAAEEGPAGRITAKGVRSLRRKLGMSRARFALLVGTTGQSVYNWEKATRPLKLRRATKEALLGVRRMGRKEIAVRMAEKSAGPVSRRRRRRTRR